MIECTDFSSICRLLRVTAYVLCFGKPLKGSPTELNPVNPILLHSSEITEAELAWIRVIQSNLFTIEIQSLCTGKDLKPLLICQFGLYRDERDHVIRCQGRINNASLPSNAKNPILLPNSGHIVALIIQRAHVKLMHSGVRETLTLLREQYWILRGRQAVRKVIRSCVTCRKFEGAFYPAISSPDLPEIRVSDDPPFTHTGLDFAGPLLFRSKSCGKGQEARKEKAYICLLTCAST